MKRTKIGKTYNTVIQVIILCLSWGFIYDQVFFRKNLPQILLAVRDDFNNPVAIRLIILVILLMFFNWAVETAKWRFLMGKIEPIRYWKAFQAVLTGVTVSTFTPNRIGEYFGRVFILNTVSRVEGILVTILGSMSQLIITLLTGSIALLVFIPVFLTRFWHMNSYLYMTVVAVVAGFNLLILGLYLNVSFLSALKEKILRNRWKKIRKYLRVFAFYHTRDLARVLFLSLLRYLIFSFQFYILLHIMDVPVPYPDAMMLISLVYFVMAVIPTIAITELGIRGSVALYFFGIYFSQQPELTDSINFGVLAASTLLWAINLGIPALTGSVFVFRLKFFRRTAKTGNA